jgi:hypothetical protein
MDFCVLHDFETAGKGLLELDDVIAVIERAGEKYRGRLMEGRDVDDLYVPMADVDLRREMFDEIAAGIPKEHHPVVEVPRIINVTESDAEKAEWLLVHSLFNTPTEPELENSRCTKYSNVYEDCRECGRSALKRGTVDFISPKVFKNSGQILEFPNGEMFCTKKGRQTLDAAGITGICYEPTGKQIAKAKAFGMTIAEHKWTARKAVCDTCGCVQEKHLTLFNSIEPFAWDVQRIRDLRATHHVISQKVYRILEDMAEDYERYEYTTPIVPGYECQLLSSGHPTP